MLPQYLHVSLSFAFILNQRLIVSLIFSYNLFSFQIYHFKNVLLILSNFLKANLNLYLFKFKFLELVLYANKLIKN